MELCHVYTVKNLTFLIKKKWYFIISIHLILRVGVPVQVCEETQGISVPH